MRAARSGSMAGRTMMGFAQEAWLYSRSRAIQGAMEFDRAGRADGAVRRQAERRRSRSGPTIGTAIRPIARACSSASTTRRCPIRSWSAAISIRFSPTTCGSISTIRRRRSWRRSSSAPRSRPMGRLTSSSRGRCRTIRTFISSRAAGAAMSASISSAAQMQVRMRVVSDAHDPKADISTLKAFAVEGGSPGVVAA